MKKIIYLLIIIFLVSGCSIKEKAYTSDFSYMDTIIEVKIYSNNKEVVDKAMNEVDKIYKEYDHLSDRYHEYKNLINIAYINNKLSLNKEQRIDKKLYDMLSFSKTYNEISNHYFNIALGNVIDVWAQYRDGKKEGIPSLNELQSSGSIDLDALKLLNNNTITKTNNISLDLGAIAKGYATEKVGQYLESIGLDKYLITAGTSSIKAGNHYNNGKYRIGLINPEDGTTQYKILVGNNISITTSGSYVRYYEYQGVRYSHIIDPHTLYPSNNMLSVTVITPSAALGDILSTTLFLMPIEEGREYLKAFSGVEAIWYGIDGQITKSSGLDKYE